MPADAVALRPARAEDAAFARRLYFQTNRWIVEALFGWDEARERQRFVEQFRPEEARIATRSGIDIGWLQAAPAGGVLRLKQICIAPAHQGRGFGTSLLRGLIAEADAMGLPMELTVARINRAGALYQRLGFAIVGGNDYEVTMRREIGAAPQPQ